MRVHAGGRLIEHEQLRPGRQRAPDLKAPLLAVGEIARQHIAAAAQPDKMEELDRFSSCAALRRAWYAAC